MIFYHIPRLIILRQKFSYEQQEGYLPQTDRASTFVVDRVKVCLTSSLITVQNLVVVSHTVYAHVEGFLNLGTPGMRPWLTPYRSSTILHMLPCQILSL